MKLPRRCVVFVDDQAHWLRSMAPAFEDEARVYLYTSPLEALEQVPKRRPEAVVLASRMAHASGAQVARALKRRLGDRCPRLVLLVEPDERPTEADRALFAEVHVKPLERRTLCAILARAAQAAAFERRVAPPALERLVG